MNGIENALGFHSIIDWLVIIAILLVGVIAAIIWLGVSVERQFRHHDRDLRAEVEKISAGVERLLAQSVGRSFS
jgi:hypothetical protein